MLPIACVLGLSESKFFLGLSESKLKSGVFRVPDTVCVIIIGSGNYLIIGTSAILINSKAEPCHVNELPIPLVCQKRVKRALRAHQP